MNREVCEHFKLIDEYCEECYQESVQYVWGEKAGGFTLEKEMKRVIAEIEQLQAENVLLREALGEYATDENSMGWIAIRALATTPETAKISAVLDAARKWKNSFDCGCCDEDLETKTDIALYDAVTAMEE